MGGWICEIPSVVSVGMVGGPQNVISDGMVVGKQVQSLIGG